MSADLIANYIETFATCSQAYPILFCLFIFVFMTIESSFIPFPSEVVMIPAGFLVARYNMLTPWHIFDLGVIILVGLAGSLLGAFINYVLAIRLGRPFLHKYGKYFFLKEQALDRAEEIFRDYGDGILSDVLGDALLEGGPDGYVKEWNINGETVTLGVKCV